MKNIVVYCSCTENYIHRVKTLYNSLKENSNINYDFIVRVVGFDYRKYSFFDDKQVIETDNVLLSKEKTLISLDRHSYSEEQAYSAKIRFLDVFDILNQKDKNILCIDADSLVRGDLNGLDNLIDENDILVHMHLNANKLHYRLKAGVIYVKNNKRSKLFFKNVSDYLKKDKNLITWFSEQIALYNAYNLKVAKVLNLPKSYIDWNFEDDSIIWTAKGDTKNNKKYILEEKKYEY